MTLQSSGAISMSNINVELGRSATDSINLNEAAVRALAGVPSGTIRMSDFYGKSFFTLGFDSIISAFSGGSSPSFMDAAVVLQANGTVNRYSQSGSAVTRWGTPTTAGIGSQYEALVQYDYIQIDPTVNVDSYVKFNGVNAALGNTSWYSLSTGLVLEARSYSYNGVYAYAEGRVYVRQISNPSNISNTTFTITTNSDL